MFPEEERKPLSVGGVREAAKEVGRRMVRILPRPVVRYTYTGRIKHSRTRSKYLV